MKLTLLSILLALPLGAAVQLQKGQTFSDTAPDNIVTTAKLHALIENASLLPGAITEQPALTDPADADVLLVGDASATWALRKLSIAQLFMSAPFTNGVVNQFGSAAFTNAVGYQFTSTAFTNAVASQFGTTAFTNQVTIVTAGAGYTSAAITLTPGGLLNAAHGLGARPTIVRAVIECATAENGYAVGDQIDAAQVHNTNDEPAFNYGANASNVFASYNTSTAGDLRILNKTTGVMTAGAGGVVEANWKFKLIAKP